MTEAKENTMNERIDHADLAARLTGAEWRRGDVAVAQLMEAQVHATLALVEQQRIANLIALAALPDIAGFENEVYDASTSALMEGLLDSELVAAIPGYGPGGVEQSVLIRPGVRAALGLAVSS